MDITGKEAVVTVPSHQSDAKVTVAIPPGRWRVWSSGSGEGAFVLISQANDDD